MIFYALVLFIYSCFCSREQSLGALEHSFNNLRIRTDFETSPVIFPDIIDFNQQIGNFIDEDYSDTIKLLVGDHNIDFVGTFFWNFNEYDEPVVEAVFKGVNLSTSKGKFKFYKLTRKMISQSIDNIMKEDYGDGKDQVINDLKQLYNRFTEELFHICESYPNCFK